MLRPSMHRRDALRILAAAFLFHRFGSPRAFAGAPAPWEKALVETGPVNGAARDNFAVIFSDPRLRDDFKGFLVNVYHLYPEDRFQQLLLDCAGKHDRDEDTYRELSARIPEVKPFLSELTYALPALAKQKEEMAAQAARLIGPKPVNGYVEIGTPGRYVTHLQKALPMSGRVLLVHDHEPGFSPLDVAERGSLSRVGDYLPLDDYAPWTAAEVPDASVDVVTNFIGIHHSPRDRLDGFVRSIHRALRPGGRFVLRDHDAHSRELNAMVGLAHDVFNAGLGVPWEKNERELRYFKPLPAIEAYLARHGFARTGETLYQTGDPTRNALMLYVKKS